MLHDRARLDPRASAEMMAFTGSGVHPPGPHQDPSDPRRSRVGQGPSPKSRSSKEREVSDGHLVAHASALPPGISCGARGSSDGKGACNDQSATGKTTTTSIRINPVTNRSEVPTCSLVALSVRRRNARICRCEHSWLTPYPHRCGTNALVLRRSCCHKRLGVCRLVRLGRFRGLRRIRLSPGLSPGCASQVADARKEQGDSSLHATLRPRHPLMAPLCVKTLPGVGF